MGYCRLKQVGMSYIDYEILSRLQSIEEGYRRPSVGQWTERRWHAKRHRKADPQTWT